MATTTSQTSSFRPLSPENVKPNPHPYAVRTTSTGVLSRSNSSLRKDGGRNHYVPLSPTKEQFNLRDGETKKMQGRPGHKFSRSLTGSDSPMPISLPTDKDGSIVFLRSSSPTKDLFGSSSSMPNLNTFTPSPSPSPNHRPLPLPPSTPPVIPPELPSNPKEWTPSQLAVYLGKELRVRRGSTGGIVEGSGEGENLPALVATDIAEFIQKRGVTGKVFIRFSENDLEELHINPLWRHTLLEASQRLRRSVLQGRIWGFGSSSSSSPSSSVPSSPAKSDGSLPDTDTTPQRRAAPPSPTLSDDSILSISSKSSLQRGRRLYSGRHSNGKVKGMVESFERDQSQSHSDSSPPPPMSPRKEDRPLPNPRRPLPETPVEEFDEVFNFGGTAKAKGSLRGDKFGSVRGSRSSGGSAGRRPLGSDLFSRGPSPRTASTVFSSSYTVEEPPSKAAARKSIMGAEEPSIEELLEQEDAKGGQGAIAWESGDVGETMKRLTGVSVDESRLLTGGRAWEEDRVGKVTMKHIPAPHNNSKLVLAICASSSEEEVEQPTFETKSVCTEDEDEQDDDEVKQLENQISTTRTMIDILTQRVTEIEDKVSSMESLIEVRALPPAPTTIPDTTLASAPKPVNRNTKGLLNMLQCLLWNPRRALDWSWMDMKINRPTSFSGIPPYMFLVSLGMCAVVLRVVMRRTSGLVNRR